ncbi:hypothetical protein [Devosia submarina]|uniref:hypothetical protein n=1 Tax=Devosia submarina TaxID=1173082 RepID=UPI000D389B77|nr:hypothetical protein [Devosia submarina]
MATRDDPPLTTDQLEVLAKRGSNVRDRAWMIRSMAQEILRRRQWDAPPQQFTITPAEQRMIEALRAMQDERKDAA